MSTDQRSSSRQLHVRDLPIRDLVEQYPEVMPVLDRYGMDLCCGGGYTVPEAALLHGVEPARLIDEVYAVIETAGT